MLSREKLKSMVLSFKYLTQIRPISVSCCLNKDYSSREASFMNKLMAFKPGKKKFYQDDRSSRSIQRVISDPSSQKRTPLRVSVLNKLFMTHVTDILATGDLSEELIGRGMEVTNVSVNKDYQMVKVYWVAKSKEDEIWLTDHLPKLSHSLRHELSQLYLMGNIPRIQFFLDQRNSKLASIDDLIMSCDKGDEESCAEVDFSPENIYPTMTHNVYGLQHDLLVSKIMKSLNKSKAPHRKKAFDCSDHKSVEDGEDMSSRYSQKESIRKFLLQRKLNEMKYRRNKFENLDSYVDETSDDDHDVMKSEKQF